MGSYSHFVPGNELYSTVKRVSSKIHITVAFSEESTGELFENGTNRISYERFTKATVILRIRKGVTVDLGSAYST
ncbi:hypothetical protein PHISP_06139 [Aspergillus sp. HF37]|nr:hypothetical protein PHISP_06139 [Aspergillus sp. HF37]